MQEREAQHASQPEQGLAVGLLLFLSNEGGNPSVYHRSKRQGGRVCHARLLSPVHHMLSSSPARSVDSIVLVGCCGDSVPWG